MSDFLANSTSRRSLIVGGSASLLLAGGGALFGSLQAQAAAPTLGAALLRRGSAGPAVSGLHEALNLLMNAGLPASTVFTAGTASAVRGFQASVGLRADGVVGDLTKAKLGEFAGSGQALPASSTTLVVNKRRPLDPPRYTPARLLVPALPSARSAVLRWDAAAALGALAGACRAAGAGQLTVVWGYRSYAAQAGLFASSMRRRGRAGALLRCARPGHSEHQTGLAVDLAPRGGSCEAITRYPQYAWLRGNAHRFGYVLRYEAGATPITGFQFEPWHWRYVGVETATAYHAGNFTSLERFFGLPDAPDY